MDLHGVELSTTWQQKLENVPGLEKYLGLIMCLKHRAMQEDLTASEKTQNPASYQGQHEDIYGDINFHADDTPKKGHVLTVEETMTLMTTALIFTVLTVGVAYTVITIDDSLV